ncbi:hypothetical protein [Aeromonas jandaei]|uniref:hypothetical protein n=1 Tax=Aeromonas jandaei TaxID=650 RepID=UPI0036722390
MQATYIELKHGVVLNFMAIQAALNCIFDSAYLWWSGEVHHKACNFCFGLWGGKRYWEQPNWQHLAICKMNTDMALDAPSDENCRWSPFAVLRPDVTTPTQ